MRCLGDIFLAVPVVLAFVLAVHYLAEGRKK